MPPYLSLLILDERLRKQRLASAFLIFALIVLLGSIPGARAEIGQFGSGLVLHGAAYSVLTFLMYTGLQGTRAQRALKAMLGAMLMGAADELVQSMLPYRVGALLDWVVDSTAAFITAGLLRWFLPEPVATVRSPLPARPG